MTTFEEVLQRLRKQYIGKQFTLAVTLGCTEAAISFWERGKRLPQRTLMTRIVKCFRASGAPADEVAELQRAYEGHMQNRKRKEAA